MHHRGESVRVAGAQRLEHADGHLHRRRALAGVDTLLLPVHVELAVDRGSRQPGGTEREHPLEPAMGERGVEDIAAASADGGAAHERERHVGAQLSREPLQVRARETGLPQGVTGDESRRGIRRPSAHAPRDRHRLVNLQVHAAAVLGIGREQHRSLQREVAFVGRHGAALITHDRDREPVGGLGVHVLEERNRLEHGRQRMIAVAPGQPHSEVGVDLSGGSHVHAGALRDDAHTVTLPSRFTPPG